MLSAGGGVEMLAVAPRPVYMYNEDRQSLRVCNALAKTNFCVALSVCSSHAQEHHETLFVEKTASQPDVGCRSSSQWWGAPPVRAFPRICVGANTFGTETPRIHKIVRLLSCKRKGEEMVPAASNRPSIPSSTCTQEKHQQSQATICGTTVHRER